MSRDSLVRRERRPPAVVTAAVSVLAVGVMLGAQLLVGTLGRLEIRSVRYLVTAAEELDVTRVGSACSSRDRR